MLVTYYDSKQQNTIREITPNLKKKKYTITKDTAENFNKYQYYKMLLNGGYWDLWKRQVKNDKQKQRDYKRASKFKRRN